MNIAEKLLYRGHFQRTAPDNRLILILENECYAHRLQIRRGLNGSVPSAETVSLVRSKPVSCTIFWTISPSAVYPAQLFPVRIPVASNILPAFITLYERRSLVYLQRFMNTIAIKIIIKVNVEFQTSQ
jgi:hypothetical protein